MDHDVPLQCGCGRVRGVARGVSSSRGNRVVCYCDDCQAFAHFLERGSEVLDEHGGTDIYQMSPGGFEIAEGREHLRCIRLAEGGLLRWYADCCKTPVGNTLASRQVPFVGVIHSFMDHGGDGPPRDEALGPVRAGVNGRFARGDRSTLDAHDTAPPSMLLRLLPMMLMARLRGEHASSPFFDAATGKPTATPRVISDDERKAAFGSLGASRG